MEEYLTIIYRTLILYGLILLIFRLMGKREIGELSLLDLVVFIMIAEMAAITIENTETALLKSLLPIFLLVGVQILLAYISLKSKHVSGITVVKQIIIIKQGKIDEHEMRKQRYNFDDLLLQLREDGIGDISEVEYAILEPSGKLSLFKKNDSSKLTLPLIVDGAIQHEHLAKIQKTNLWLREQLKAKGYDDVTQISYCSYQNKELFIDIKDEK